VQPGGATELLCCATKKRAALGVLDVDRQSAADLACRSHHSTRLSHIISARGRGDSTSPTPSYAPAGAIGRLTKRVPGASFVCEQQIDPRGGSRGTEHETRSDPEGGAWTAR
jgi:hypothetical protein